MKIVAIAVIASLFLVGTAYAGFFENFERQFGIDITGLVTGNSLKVSPVWYTGDCTSGSEIVVYCNVFDDSPDVSLGAQLWAGQCGDDCFETRGWRSGQTVYASGEAMELVSGTSFSKTITINQQSGTPIAATCRAQKSGKYSNWGDRYPLCIVDGCQDVPLITITNPGPRQSFSNDDTITIEFSSNKPLRQDPTVKIRPGSQMRKTFEYDAVHVSGTPSNPTYTYTLKVENHDIGIADIEISAEGADGCPATQIEQIVIEDSIGTPAISTSTTEFTVTRPTVGDEYTYQTGDIIPTDWQLIPDEPVPHRTYVRLRQNVSHFAYTLPVLVFESFSPALVSGSYNLDLDEFATYDIPSDYYVMHVYVLECFPSNQACYPLLYNNYSREFYIHNLCDGVTCDTPPDNYCNGSYLHSYYDTGTCYAGVCNYTEKIPVFCSFDGVCVEIVGEDDQCESVQCQTNDVVCPDHCVGDTLYYDCGCIGFEQECPDNACKSEVCVAGCVDDACVDLCQGVACNAPPDPYCAGDISYMYGTTGTCFEGSCFYNSTIQESCEYGCNSGTGLCNTVDPCEGVTCNNPPADYCNGNLSVTYGTGTCDQGSCFYPENITECPGVCLNGNCVDCITGEDCPNGVYGWCVDDMLCGEIRGYLCRQNTCEIMSSAPIQCQTCENGCTNGVCDK